VSVKGDTARAFVLAKQGLSQAGPQDVVGVVEATAGVYGTAPTCYLSCAARLEGFRVGDLDAELYERRSLVRLRCMRGSAYIEPAAALPEVFAATREEKALERVVKAAGISAAEYERLAERIDATLAGRPPATVAEIRGLLGEDAPKALNYVVALMGRQGRLARAEVRGGWKSDVYAYARWEEWVGAPLGEVDPAAARAALARRYLRAFGPATADDLRWWAGWKVADTRAALAALGDEAAPVELDGAEALVLADEVDALAAADPAAAAGVRLLPVWDAYFMGYRDRSRQVRDDDYANVYDKAGNATSVVIEGGLAAGVWELDELTVRVAAFRRASKGFWDGVEAAARRIGAMLGEDGVRVERARRPGPLAGGARNAFLAPIRLGPA
jgi:hypothetical protein